MLFTEPFMQVRVIFAYFLLPSAEVAVIVTFLPPAFFLKVTRPLELTVATFLLLVVHFTALLVVLEGATVALSCTFFPAAILRVGAVILTPVALTTGLATVTVQVAFTLPAVAVMTAVPGFTAVTTPSSDTFATAALLEDHTTLSAVLAGATVAFRVKVLPVSSFWVVASRVMPVAGTLRTRAATAALMSAAILSTAAC